jgi:hypothetical protein
MSAQRLPKSQLRHCANSSRVGSCWQYATMRSTEAAWRSALQKIERLNQRNHHVARRIQGKKTNNHVEVRFMTKLSLKRESLRMVSLCALFFLIGVVTVHATTYYVAPTGSDSYTGTAVGTPFRSIQQCVNTVAPGDTCTVADGTYTDVDGNGIVVYISPNARQGTASLPITIKSTNQYGAHLIIPSSSVPEGLHAGLYINQNYYIIDGFDISGGGSPQLVSNNTGIVLTGGTGTIIRNNKLHDIARTVCSESDDGNAGVYMVYTTNVTADSNLLYTIGRLRNGESGCVTTHYQHDHGFYIHGTTNTMISHNVIYDTNRGWPIHVFGGTATNLSIYNNTLAGGSPTGLPVGQIMLAGTINTANVKNNISYAAITGMVNNYSLSASGIAVTFNLSNTQEKVNTWAGVTFSNNLQNTSPGFVNAASNNYYLSTGSAAINTGTNVGFQVSDGAPDIGAYELDGSTALTPPQNVRVQ